MKRALGCLVFSALIAGAISVGLVSGREPTARDQCVSGLQLCANEALIKAKVLMERCPELANCKLIPVKTSPFLGFVDLDHKGPNSCGPGDCGAAVHALQSGWEQGRWRIIAPRLRGFPYLTPPEPVEITLEPGETYEIELIYRDEFKGWPRGPFAHNCLRENSNGRGDFDGDGVRDQMRFVPLQRSGELLGWDVHVALAAGDSFTTRVEAECPEVLGAVDIDGNGRDELFFDTGKGMTAALVDLLVFQPTGLRNVVHEPKDFSLYVGASNAGSSDISCFKNERTGGLIVREKGAGVGKITTYVLRGPRLVLGVSFGGARGPRGELDCFGLHWQGY